MKTVWSGEIEWLAPLFCRGAYKDWPEIREPSIRGMVRWWFRKLGGNPQEEKEIFGGLKRFAGTEKVAASKVVFRVTRQEATEAKPTPFTLPHKAEERDGKPSPQAAFKPEGWFHLEVFPRLGGLSPELETKLKNAIEVWVLLGSLGLRANRAGGSLWPKNGAPATPSELRQQLEKFGCNWPAYLAGDEVGKTLDELRKAATDTLGGHPEVFGDRNPRRASTVKMKIVRLDGRLRLLITAPEQDPLNDAKRLLANKRAKGASWVPV